MTTLQGRAITRNRERLACSECRRRKLRCDRISPCGSCIRRGDAESCTYERPATGLEHERERRLQAETRLEQLEQIVYQLAARHGDPLADHAPAAAYSQEIEAQSVGGPIDTISARVSSDNLTYNGSTHWSAMLEDIQELRSSIVHDGPSSPEIELTEKEGPGTGLIFGCGISPSSNFQDVLMIYLPQKQDADRLISIYFRAKAVAAPFVHSLQFLRQYQAFWDNPGGASPLWTSMLFSVLYVATYTLRRGKGCESVDYRFSSAAAQCLAIGEYFRPKRFAVESLLLYAHAQCLTSHELPSDIGPLFGVLVRLASSMGYHREPDMTSQSPFEKEMRRRTWSACMQLDLLVSFHLGLPSGVQFPTWDTTAPRNLLDSDFDESSMVLPSPRPETEITGILFYITKHRFMAVFEKILRHVLGNMTNTDSPVYAEVDVLDAELQGVYDALPEILRPRTMAQSIIDSADVIITRLTVSFLYKKCRCVLHRPYVTSFRLPSMKICFDMAVGLVRDFLDAYQECLPGGQLDTQQWFMTSITWHDFLLGVSSLCLALCTGSEGQHCLVNRELVMGLLTRAERALSEQVGHKRKDTARGLSIVRATIRCFGRQTRPPSSSAPVRVAMPTGNQAIEPARDGVDWTLSDEVISPMNDTSWTYLEQFLDLGGINGAPEI
ncbi:hypothetical protein GQ53DRAFT_852327 [Thozetella sp. PMI_491]|nr:hypothetical protein GQ53DRAFT_852327 [Thozetella sp. PMI_491]